MWDVEKLVTPDGSDFLAPEERAVCTRCVKSPDASVAMTAASEGFVKAGRKKETTGPTQARRRSNWWRMLLRQEEGFYGAVQVR